MVEHWWLNSYSTSALMLNVESEFTHIVRLVGQLVDIIMLKVFVKQLCLLFQWDQLLKEIIHSSRANSFR